MRSLSFLLGHSFGGFRMGFGGNVSAPTTGSKWKGAFCTFTVWLLEWQLLSMARRGAGRAENSNGQLSKTECTCIPV